MQAECGGCAARTVIWTVNSPHPRRGGVRASSTACPVSTSGPHPAWTRGIALGARARIAQRRAGGDTEHAGLDLSGRTARVRSGSRGGVARVVPAPARRRRSRRRRAWAGGRRSAVRWAFGTGAGCTAGRRGAVAVPDSRPRHHIGPEARRRALAVTGSAPRNAGSLTSAPPVTPSNPPSGLSATPSTRNSGPRARAWSASRAQGELSRRRDSCGRTARSGTPGCRAAEIDCRVARPAAAPLPSRRHRRSLHRPTVPTGHPRRCHLPPESPSPSPNRNLSRCHHRLTGGWKEKSKCRVGPRCSACCARSPAR